jgi:hypothetical protein
MLKMAVTIVLDAEVPLQGNGLPLPEALVNLNEVPGNQEHAIIFILLLCNPCTINDLFSSAWRRRNTWRTIWTRCDAALVTTEMPR